LNHLGGFQTYIGSVLAGKPIMLAGFAGWSLVSHFDPFLRAIISFENPRSQT
jgi:hypothetical protein